jgi:hypothetical protein
MRTPHLHVASLPAAQLERLALLAACPHCRRMPHVPQLGTAQSITRAMLTTAAACETPRGVQSMMLAGALKPQLAPQPTTTQLRRQPAETQTTNPLRGAHAHLTHTPTRWYHGRLWRGTPPAHVAASAGHMFNR